MASLKQTVKLLLIGASLLMPFAGLAHGIETSQSQDMGEFTVEFEYNSGDSVTAGDYLLYNVYLLQKGTETGVHYDYAFFRIEKQSGPSVLAGSLVESSDNPGYAAMGGIIPEAGAYTSAVSFYKDGNTLAEAEFDFQVSPSAAAAERNSGRDALVRRILLPLGLLLGLGLGFWLGRRRFTVL